VRILKTFNEMYGLFFKGAQNVRTKNIFNPNKYGIFCTINCKKKNMIHVNNEIL